MESGETSSHGSPSPRVTDSTSVCDLRRKSGLGGIPRERSVRPVVGTRGPTGYPDLPKTPTCGRRPMGTAAVSRLDSSTHP